MIQADILTLDPGPLVVMYELDTSAAGGSAIYRFHDGIGTLHWQGNEYEPWPVEATGFDISSKGSLPRPTVKFANVTGLLTGIVYEYDDLVGCTFTRRRTFEQYLDGKPAADPTMELGKDVYFVERKVSENSVYVEFELVSAMDLENTQIPSRAITQNYCTWDYRSAECSYTGSNYFDVGDNPVPLQTQDVCGKRMSSCQCRFGASAVLPVGMFPGAKLYRNQ